MPSASKPYMVIFKNSAPKSAIEQEIKAIEEAGGTLKQRFDSDIMRGFAAAVPETYAKGLEAKSVNGQHEHIEYIEPDSEVKTM
ncbi:hypothetical protein FA09DRAFT_328398 [Tilletiopsis washingtonensis]|uniref:Inhibitor I9 domain-containing protein n=1 Tax=Tilletiopsis washingtonensis TaxID=58919 RepID=A0A316ZE69_9BASI|nr:hypothetical protein FA09DRAFT_328398 [Tilletiopsis washingtonensis]PWN99596.1 hypothetical protein FA09DRAFT_328398 [Tilletiopsis washingtonensis]